MVYWDRILVGRGWRQFKSGLASIMKIVTFSPADQEYVNTAQVVELEWFVKTVPNIVHVQLEYSSVCVCVCIVGTKIHNRSLQKLMFEGALSLLQSLKGGEYGFPECVVTLWDMVSPFYLKLALMQWTHPSSMRATKCKVCQYAWRQWHLYSVLQESWYEHICDMLCWLH